MSLRAPVQEQPILLELCRPDIGGRFAHNEGQATSGDGYFEGADPDLAERPARCAHETRQTARPRAAFVAGCRPAPRCSAIHRGLT